ncbi:hypothetical protein N7493_007562 [Penicillium malachiteum]|uniref:Aromatic amino acid beta-eliminating lyase/threonine aldolase domain-containing protein n=1 Tax=Penicillium malachiteum TaxID=1324776 RepID=A0AAD6HHV8_9EURO|nr:hypothetical protein N7493_007562 [Penicillium malachiteum]
MHLDGARLWEAIVAEGVEMKDYLDCFDTASLCLSKGIGAPMGSVIVGPKEIIDRAIWFRKMFGGATRQTGMMAAAALVALDEHLPRLAQVHSLASQVGRHLQDIGFQLLLPVSTNMVILDLKGMGIPGDILVKYCKRHDVRAFHSGRLVFHHQTSKDGVSRLQSALLELINDHQSYRRLT